MPERNRVLPTGEIVAASFRGSWMGNRGGPISSDPVRRQWSSRTWIYCHLSFNGRNSVFRQPGRRYTELFFYDEAHALAAGHRPCGECQHRRLVEFKTAAGFSANTPVGVIDKLLHSQRLSAPDHVPFGTVPDGSVVLATGDTPIVVWQRGAFAWTREAGYTRTASPEPTESVPVLTPPVMRTALTNGFAIRIRELRE